ncbi:MAG: hypothetical protein ACK4IA_16475 [Paracoccus hibiscisoli]|uniref:hypothetical protein n=1 Tax=Paracoccus hibiscisoli TaxID=2023261 RepID=UPI00391BA77D
MEDTIKRGATFRVAFRFDGDAEWERIYPNTTATASVIDSKGATHTLSVATDVPGKAMVLTGTTANWSLGRARYDLLIVKGGTRIPVPFSENATIVVIDGVTS